MGIWKPLVLLGVIVCTFGCSEDAAKDASATPAEANPNHAAAVATATPPADSVKPRQTPKPIQIPSGTELTIILLDALSSAKNKAGDSFTANLASAILIGGTEVIEKGARVQGKVVDAEGSGRVKGVANIRLILTGLTHNGKVIPIVTEANLVEAAATTGRDAAVIGGGAGIGAAIGAIAGGKQGAVTGGVIGGAAGTGTVLATRGKEVEFPAESKLTFTLEKDFEVSPATASAGVR